ncbi:MAG: hypothetical protein WBM07_09890 [Chitinivibrionales bacterium]
MVQILKNIRPLKYHYLCWTVVCALFAFKAYGAVVDTTIAGNGGPGPYQLGKNFIEAASIRLAFADTARKRMPSFTFIEEMNALLFSEPIDSGVTIKVHFLTGWYGLPKIYSLFDKSYIEPRDTIFRAMDTVVRVPVNAFAEENLTVSGYKSVGVSVNNLGSTNLEQAVDVSLTGNIAPHTTLSGHLTDQGSSLEGSTREVSDLDMVYVSLDNPHYNALVGDQYAEWPVNGMFSGKKKIKGISAGLSVSGISIKGFGALAGGNFTIQTITGKNGLQGPYMLMGNQESGFVMPIQGTVKVSIGEKKYSEGSDQDFTVDYDLGSLTFTPRTLIRDEDIIRIEYEYRVFDYQRTFTGTTLGASTRDSSVTVVGALWYETDNKNQPLDMTLSEADKALLANQGDTSKLRFSGRLIDPKDVAWESSQQPLYTVDSLGHYHFTAFDPQNPNNNQGFYYVSFQTTGLGNGDYDLDSTAMHAAPGLGPIYRYVGAGNGSATLPPIPLPQSTMTGEVLTKARFAPWASAMLDIAGMDHDRNLFSGSGGQDTRGAAVNGSVMLGVKRADRRSLWLDVKQTYITPGMTNEVSSAFDRNRLWDDTTSATLTGRRMSWESTGGTALWNNTMTEMTYGQYMHDGALVDDRIENSTQVAIQKHLLLDYNGDFFRHWTANGVDRTRRDDGQLKFNSSRADISLECKDEWRTLTDAFNSGLAGAGAGIQVKPLSLRESVFYTLFRRGAQGLINAVDTGHSLLWDNEITRAFSPSWHANMSSHYLMEDIYNQEKNTTILVTAQDEVSIPNKGFITRQTYQVNIERAATFVQVPVPVGKGLGDYVWNDTLKEYVPGKNGDYTIQEQQVYGGASESRVRKTNLNATWSLNHSRKRRLPGILGDLDFSGTFNSDEQLSLDRPLPASSWIPGYGSLFKKENAGDSLVRYADISYRQNIQWNPDSLPGYHGQLYVQPSYKKIRDYSESGAEYGGGADRTIKNWFIGAEGSIVAVTRQSTDSLPDNNYFVSDRHAQLTEKNKFFRDFSAYLKEAGGYAAKTSDGFVNGGWYYRVVPGVSWQPAKKGMADLSYTYSSVDIPGTLDYRMAQGFSAGITHTIDFSAHLNFGTHFTTDISWKSQFGGAEVSKNGLHVISMQMKALL